MPKVNGMEILKTLRSDEQNRDVSLIKLTAGDDDKDD
jgi:CheY-like chemotaxis protein